MFGIPVGGQPGTVNGIGGSEMTEPLVGPFERFPLDFPVCNSDGTVDGITRRSTRLVGNLEGESVEG